MVPKRMKVKVTVVKNLGRRAIFGKELPEVADGVEDVCVELTEGQEFMVQENGKIPEGFCTWAWHDIYPEVTHLRFGGSFPWMKKEGVIYSSCSDGLRPVIFKLERVE